MLVYFPILLECHRLIDPDLADPLNSNISVYVIAQMILHLVSLNLYADHDGTPKPEKYS